jgi:hypothetical protein
MILAHEERSLRWRFMCAKKIAEKKKERKNSISYSNKQ